MMRMLRAEGGRCRLAEDLENEERIEVEVESEGLVERWGGPMKIEAEPL